MWHLKNLVELWVVVTRPLDQNGLGMSIPDAMSELTRVKSVFTDQRPGLPL
ncbi:MAG: hypothetical protein ACLP59_26460 [Bryobacteraceae bacterium]